MTPTQRAAALRLADALTGVGFVANDLNLAAALLRELAAEPVQEPAIWIQSNHLQHAKNGPYLARTGPTKLMSDFIPLYAAPQQRKPLTDEQLKQAMSDAGVRVFQPGLWDVLLDAGRAIERAHGITGEPT